jgi:hypothetical protein
MKLRPYQKAAIASLPASIVGGLKDIATLLQTEPREATVGAIKARPAAAMQITAIDTAALDHLLAPYIGAGLLRTHYERITGATEYRGPTGRLMALSIGTEHFATANQPPLALTLQCVGRAKRPAGWTGNERAE